ncbi:MAG: hypothetical protein AAF357_01675 [Verrucomicrobiota bacterium]
MPISSPPQKTFLVEADGVRFRVDLRLATSGFQVIRVLHDQRAESASAGSPTDLDPLFSAVSRSPIDTRWIHSLLKGRPSPAREVTVLSDRITAVVAEIPDASLESWQSGAEMEAQTVSGLSSSEAVAASVRLPAGAGIVRTWIVQAAMRNVIAIRTAVSEASRGRLVSLGHPAGVRLDPRVPQLESWSEFALFHVGSGDRIDLRGWNGPEAMEQALEDREVSSSLASARDQSRLLLAVSPDSLRSAPPSTAETIDFTDPGGIDIWCNALAQACDPLTGRVLSMPLVSVPKAPPSRAERMATTFTTAGVTLLLLVGHFFFTARSRAQLKGDLTRLKAPTTLLATNQKRINELQRQLKELEQSRIGIGEDKMDFFAHRKRIGALLGGVAAGAGVKEAIVLELRSEGMETLVSGVAMTYHAPVTLAREIDDALAAHGWRATLELRTAKLLEADGGPWSYEIRLTPDRPVTTEAQSMPSSEDPGKNATPLPSELVSASTTGDPSTEFAP